MIAFSFNCSCTYRNKIAEIRSLLYMNIILYFFQKVKLIGGEGGVRTHVAVARPNGFANRPLYHLSTSPRGGIIYHQIYMKIKTYPKVLSDEPRVSCGGSTTQVCYSHYQAPQIRHNRFRNCHF